MYIRIYIPQSVFRLHVHFIMIFSCEQKHALFEIDFLWSFVCCIIDFVKCIYSS